MLWDQSKRPRDLGELERLEKELMRSARELERLWRVFGTPGKCSTGL